VSDHDQMVADYLRRLSEAAGVLPADGRAELIEEITAHIAEARAAGPSSVPDILQRLGDPVQIVRAAAEPPFGAPYPDGGQMPSAPRPPAPAPVRTAVRLMYAGAALSLVKVLLDLATEHATRSDELSALKAGARRSGVHTTVSQLNAGITASLALAFVLGLIGAGLWLLVARGSRNGKDWARATGSVFFGLDTLALLIGPPDVGIHGPGAALVKILTGIIWLIGLAAVVCLWRKDSGAFFKGLGRPVRASSATTRPTGSSG
jgi:hypothetical protein